MIRSLPYLDSIWEGLKGMNNRYLLITLSLLLIIVLICLHSVQCTNPGKALSDRLSSTKGATEEYVYFSKPNKWLVLRRQNVIATLCLYLVSIWHLIFKQRQMLSKHYMSIKKPLWFLTTYHFAGIWTDRRSAFKRWWTTAEQWCGA